MDITKRGTALLAIIILTLSLNQTYDEEGGAITVEPSFAFDSEDK